MALVAAPSVSSEQRIVLQDVAWETYERLLADHMDSSSPRFAYDRGVLEIVSPSAEHEERNRTLASLVEVVAEETTTNFRNMGSLTFRRRDLERGFEPESAFYVQHAPLVRGKRQIDPSVDPPPDLVIEIDITSSPLNKLPLYARMGVLEVWRDDGERLRILLRRLGGDGYDEVAASRALPILTTDVLNGFLVESQTLDRPIWLRMVREWARAHRAADGAR